MTQRDELPIQPAGETSRPAEQPDAAPQSATEEGDLEALRQELEEVARRGQEYLSIAQRAQADLMNYRRRVEAERGESFRAGKTELALRLLPVLDDLDLAFRNMSSGVAESHWAKGFDLIARKLRAALEADGIARFDALGADFDPYQHEAVLQGPSTEVQAGKVVEVYREGYRYGDRILRPAQVKVGQGGA
jgi:molecular chaperone GrpE